MTLTPQVLLQATAPARVVRVAPRGRILAAGFDDGLLALWGYEPGVRELKRVSTGDAVRDVIWSPRLSLLVTVGPEHLRGWRVPDLGDAFAWQVGPIDGAQFLAEGGTAMVAGAGRLSEIDLRDGRRLRQSAPLGGRLVQLEAHRDGSLLALTDAGRLLRIDPGTFTVSASTDVGEGADAFSLSPDGERCAVASGAVRVVPLAGGAPLALRDVEGSCAPAWSAEGRLLAAGSDDGRVLVYDSARQRVLHVLEGHAGPITSLAMLHGQGTLASSGADGTVRAWDLRQSRR